MFPFSLGYYTDGNHSSFVLVVVTSTQTNKKKKGPFYKNYKWLIAQLSTPLHFLQENRCR